MDRVKKLIHTDYVYRRGISGENVTVAVMDTGIAVHPDFDRRIVVFKDFCNGKVGLLRNRSRNRRRSGES